MLSYNRTEAKAANDARCIKMYKPRVNYDNISTDSESVLNESAAASNLGTTCHCMWEADLSKQHELGMTLGSLMQQSLPSVDKLISIHRSKSIITEENYMSWKNMNLGSGRCVRRAALPRILGNVMEFCLRQY